MIFRNDLEQYLNQQLNVAKIRDYSPNGLQVEGKNEIQRIVTGVTASAALIDKAIEMKADAVLVHHGYFWKGEAYPIVGMKKQRIAKLLANDINLFAYHLPVDVHPEWGNNAQLGQMLGIKNITTVDPSDPACVVCKGEFEEPVSLSDLSSRIEQKLNRQPLVNDARAQDIKTVAWCTGGGQSYIDLAADLNIDCFITGEVSEHTIHSSNEQLIDFISAGHHATERYGIQTLGRHLAQKFALNVEFVDINNPV